MSLGSVEIPPKVPSRGYSSDWREAKIVAHTTRRGKGKVARALRKVRKARVAGMVALGLGIASVAEACPSQIVVAIGEMRTHQLVVVATRGCKGAPAPTLWADHMAFPVPLTKVRDMVKGQVRYEAEIPSGAFSEGQVAIVSYAGKNVAAMCGLGGHDDELLRCYGAYWVDRPAPAGSGGGEGGTGGGTGPSDGGTPSPTSPGTGGSGGGGGEATDGGDPGGTGGEPSGGDGPSGDGEAA